jgi:membrane associated rhomboid family serine protease
MLACPIHFWIFTTSIPLAAHIVPNVCLRSWKTIASSRLIPSGLSSLGGSSSRRCARPAASSDDNPELGASGAIAAVLGAYFVLYPNTRVLTLVVVFLVRIPAWLFLGGWFLFQLVEGNFGIFSASADGGGTAFFAHVGGFLFGVLVARRFVGAAARASAPAIPSPAGR